MHGTHYWIAFTAIEQCDPYATSLFLCWTVAGGLTLIIIMFVRVRHAWTVAFDIAHSITFHLCHGSCARIAFNIALHLRQLLSEMPKMPSSIKHFHFGPGDRVP